MKRYIITYSILDRFVTADINAHNMWEALQIFDALDISVDETLGISRIPMDLKVSHDRANRFEIKRKAAKPLQPSTDRNIHRAEPVQGATVQPFGRSRRSRFGAKYNAQNRKGTACQSK